MESIDKSPDISVKRFLLLTLIWMPITFFIWAGLGNWFTFPAAFLADKILPLMMPGVIEGVEQQGVRVDIMTTLVITANDQTGQFVPTFNALKYGYGIPLILAMVLAVPYSIYDKLDNIIYGVSLAFLTQAWGVCFETLAFLLLKTGPDIRLQIQNLLTYADNDWFLNFIALGYQLGYLILPAIVPIAFWVLRHQSFLEHISRNRSG